MNALRRIALSAAFALATAPALAAPIADATAAIAPSASAASRLINAPLETSRQDAGAAAASYFDFDALVTLAALALAGGSLAAFAAYAAQRRRAEEAALAAPAWRETVFMAVEVDLERFAQTLRPAA
jgi:hypothetical protein